MRISRIYTEQKLTPGGDVDLDGRAHRYISQVLRLRAGQGVVLFDGRGADYAAELVRCDRKACRARIDRMLSSESPAALQLNLGIGVSRGERMGLAIQKSVELGVHAITPLSTERSVVQLTAERHDRRMLHWQGVVIGACEQSGRSLLPDLHPVVPLHEWLAKHPAGLMLFHEARQSLAEQPEPGRSLNLLIGPEGGLSGSERALAEGSDFVAVRLGPRVLRTETAPLAALAAIQALWGDFRQRSVP